MSAHVLGRFLGSEVFLVALQDQESWRPRSDDSTPLPVSSRPAVLAGPTGSWPGQREATYPAGLTGRWGVGGEHAASASQPRASLEGWLGLQTSLAMKALGQFKQAWG